jgi:hypothetical protein
VKTLLDILNNLPCPFEACFHITIHNPPHSPLTIKGLGTGPRNHPAISVAHYGEKNGNLWSAPELFFELELADGVIVALLPYYLRNDCIGVEELAVTERQPENVYLMESQTSFATAWSNTLKEQGFDRAVERTLAKAMADCVAD